MTDRQNGGGEPGQDFERITPARVRPGAAPAGAPVREPARKSLPAVAVWGILAIVLLGAGAVFFWLPGSIGQRQTTPAEDQASAQTTKKAGQLARQPQQTAPPDADTVLQQRQQAQTLADRAAAKRGKLQDKGVTQWAQADFNAAAEQVEQGKAQFKARDFEAAAGTYRGAIADFDDLLERADKVLSQAVARGQKALADGEGKAADAAFSLALAVDPDNAAAQQGKRRAASLDQVLALLHSGRAHERAGELTAAREDFQQAHQLDGQAQAAADGLARVRAALAQRAYRGRMSVGLAALDRGDYGAARDAFTAAGKLRPGSAEAADGLTQARAGLEQQAIAQHRERGHSLEDSEQWRQAAAEYKAALALDKTLSFARQGLERASKRAELDERLSYHIEHPQRLQSDNVREAARSLLAQAGAVSEPGPTLRRQMSQLAGLIDKAATPVPVQLRSDEKTRVLVYHVGDLGRFASKRIELPPGDYTAIGRRDGYRDVRREFTVAAGRSNGPIVIRCEEKI